MLLELQVSFCRVSSISTAKIPHQSDVEFEEKIPSKWHRRKLEDTQIEDNLRMLKLRFLKNGIGGNLRTPQIEDNLRMLKLRFLKNGIGGSLRTPQIEDNLRMLKLRILEGPA